MATGKTYVAFEVFAALIRASGLPTENKSRWIKIQGPGGKLYVPKAKMVGTVHISGFEVPVIPGIRNLDELERPTGQVKQEQDFRDRTLEQIVEMFEGLLLALACTVKPVKAVAPSAPEAPLPAAEATDSSPAEELAAEELVAS
jgi:hypothetical protein